MDLRLCCKALFFFLFCTIRPREVVAEVEGLYGQPVNNSPEVELSGPKEVMGTLMAAVELEEESQ